MFNPTTSSLSTTLFIFGMYLAICVIVCWRNSHISRFLCLYFAGYLLLPNLDYGLSSAPQNYHEIFAYWYIGGALPSDIFLTKAFVVPSSLILCLVFFRFESFRTLRINLADVCMALWICIPAIKSIHSATYLLGVWGSSWLIGRALFQNRDDLRLLARAIVLSTSLIAPFAIMEIIQTPFLYDAIYQAHPFTADGAQRYLGFRPLLMFEHGNQFGLWAAIAAVAGFWLLLEGRLRCEESRLSKKLICITPMTICLASQSIGAITLGVAACFAIAFWSRINLRKIFLAVLLSLSVGSGVLASGAVRLDQIENIARNTIPGQKAIGFFRAIGRGSLPWRVSQDIKTAALVKDALVTGTGRWDWWRSSETRPWGMHQLIVGQFGIIGIALSSIVLGLSSFRIFWQHKVSLRRELPSSSQLIAILVSISFIDAFLNSFIFYPMILMSAAICNNKCCNALTRPAPK
jgi:hypothetical protein